MLIFIFILPIFIILLHLLFTNLHNIILQYMEQNGDSFDSEYFESLSEFEFDTNSSDSEYFETLSEFEFDTDGFHTPVSHLSDDSYESINNADQIEEIEEIEEIGDPNNLDVDNTTSISSIVEEETYEGSNNNISPQFSFSLLVLLAVAAGMTIGYELNIIGGVLSMDVYYNAVMHKIYLAEVHAETNNFCPYINYVYIAFASAIPALASLSIWIGLASCYIWSARLRNVVWCTLTLLFIGVTCIISSTFLGIQITGIVFIGISVGILHQVIPTICISLASLERKKIVGDLFYYSINVGNTVALLLNYVASKYPKFGWKISLGFPFCFMLVMVPVSIFIPNHSFIESDQFQNFRKSFNKLFLHRRERPVLIINVMGKFLPQLSGINSMVFFGPLLLGSLGDEMLEGFFAPFLLSIISLVVVLIYGLLLYRHLAIGRRLVMMISIGALLFSEIFLFIIFVHQNRFHHLKKDNAVKAFGLLLICTVGDSILLGPHRWITDTYSKETIGIGNVWEDSSSMFMSFVMRIIITLLFCKLLEFMFLLFALCSIGTLVFFYFFVPETTNFSLSTDIEILVWKRHFFWKKCIPDDDVSV